MPDDRRSVSGGRSSKNDSTPGSQLKTKLTKDVLPENQCCSVHRNNPSDVIEEQGRMIANFNEKIYKQQSAAHSSIQDSISQEMQQLSKLVSSMKEQQQGELERFKAALEDVIREQRAVMDRQEELIRQVLDQVSLDREFSHTKSSQRRTSFTSHTPIVTAAKAPDAVANSVDGDTNGNGSNGIAKALEGFTSPPPTKAAGPYFGEDDTLEISARNPPDPGGEDCTVPDAPSRQSVKEKKIKKSRSKSTVARTSSIQDLLKSASHGMKRQKSKVSRKSIEGRSNIMQSSAPWNTDDLDTSDANFMADPIFDEGDKIPEDDLFPMLSRMVNSPYFKLTFAFLILLNTIFVAVQVQYTVDSLSDDEPPPSYIAICDMVFCLLFMFEIIVRLLVERCAFFKNEMRYWNVFDLLLVILAFQEQVASFALIAKGKADEVVASNESHEGEGGNFTFLRMVRVLRILRILRVFKFCPQLSIIFQGILESMSAMIWLFVLLALILFISSLIFMSATANYLKSVYFEGETQHVTDMKRLFGTLPASIFSLFKAVSGGIQWEVLGDGLMKISLIYGSLFIIYLAFVVFGIVNVMTGVFVISAQKTQRQSEEEYRRRAFDHMNEYLDSLTGETDAMDKESFKFHLENDDRMRELLKPMEIGPSDAAHLFDLLADDEAIVANTKLASGFLRLLGGARSTDLVFLLLETRRLANEMYAFFCFVEANFRTLSPAVGVSNAARRYLPNK